MRRWNLFAAIAAACVALASPVVQAQALEKPKLSIGDASVLEGSVLNSTVDLKFTLNGYKLKGSWVLVRTGGRFPGARSGGGDRSWLLIKHRDDWSGDLDITAFGPQDISLALGQGTKTLVGVAEPLNGIAFGRPLRRPRLGRAPLRDLVGDVVDDPPVRLVHVDLLDTAPQIDAFFKGVAAGRL